MGPGGGQGRRCRAEPREATFLDHSYQLGFPLPGHWREVHNGDRYDSFPNPWTQGNQGGVAADGPPLDDLAHSAGITIPATSLLVFAHG